MSEPVLHLGLPISIQAKHPYSVSAESNSMIKDKVESDILSSQIPLLIKKCLKGDIYAAEQLYLLFFKDIFRFIYRMYSVREIVEEIVNDVFFLAFQRLETLKDHSAFRSWLLSIAVNQLRNRYKTEKKYMEQIQNDGIDMSSSDYSVEKVAIKEAVDTLPEGYREVFILHDSEGFTHVDIAKILGISEGTSKSQLFKARNHLRKVLLNNIKKNTGRTKRRERKDAVR